ncbi:hypothetical protein SASPL_126507 [Salvia splendens]|uniref:Uncharacterized protein n=1 Tax=Salvia splendens TaxID=180675 RepID=A0A8X8ZQ38_SALSN|nr:hypothetical protein SASPL_126507 [Salvia splendens]
MFSSVVNRVVVCHTTFFTTFYRFDKKNLRYLLYAFCRLLHLRMFIVSGFWDFSYSRPNDICYALVIRLVCCNQIIYVANSACAQPMEQDAQALLNDNWKDWREKVEILSVEEAA